MTYSTIYDLDGNTLTDGVQSQRVMRRDPHCGARPTARARPRPQRDRRGPWTEECYRVTPAGHKWRAPKGWLTPTWGAEEE